MVKNYWLKVKNLFRCKNTDKREKSKGEKVFFIFEEFSLLTSLTHYTGA